MLIWSSVLLNLIWVPCSPEEGKSNSPISKQCDSKSDMIKTTLGFDIPTHELGCVMSSTRLDSSQKTKQKKLTLFLKSIFSEKSNENLQWVFVFEGKYKSELF